MVKILFSLIFFVNILMEFFIFLLKALRRLFIELLLQRFDFSFFNGQEFIDEFLKALRYLEDFFFCICYAEFVSGPYFGGHWRVLRERLFKTSSTRPSSRAFVRPLLFHCQRANKTLTTIAKKKTQNLSNKQSIIANQNIQLNIYQQLRIKIYTNFY